MSLYVYNSLFNTLIQNCVSTSNKLNGKTHCVVKAIRDYVLVYLNVVSSQAYKVCQVKIHAVVWCDNWYAYLKHTFWVDYCPVYKCTCSVTPGVKNSYQNSVSTRNDDKTSRGFIVDNLYHHIILHTNADETIHVNRINGMLLYSRQPEGLFRPPS